MFRTSKAKTMAAAVCVVASALSSAQGDDSPFALTLRTRVPAPGYGAARVVETPASWAPRETAVIVCDMWDLHHCLNATRRGNELAPRIDALLKAVRSRGTLVIHAPSSCMNTYKDHPARKRAQAVPKSQSLPPEIGQWCRKIPKEEEGSYPVDQTDGGEDDDLAEHARWAARLTALAETPAALGKARPRASPSTPRLT